MKHALNKPNRYLLGLSVRRTLTIIIGVVFLISGLGSSVFWLCKLTGHEIFIPFGLSTFRALNWPVSDALLIACCMFAAFHCLKNSSCASNGAMIGGASFIVQGLIGLYVNFSEIAREQLNINTGEPQPIVLLLWFLGWGTFSVWMSMTVLLLPVAQRTELSEL